ncbi:hypothetical protein Hanom_Chr09g00777451 [Helianthus anomalus]
MATFQPWSGRQLTVLLILGFDPPDSILISIIMSFSLVFHKSQLLLLGIMEFNNPNFHQLAGNGLNFKNSHWRSKLLTFCKTLDSC